MFASLSQREKIMIIVGIIILFFAFYYFYLYLPVSEKIESLQSNLKQKENNIKTLQNLTKDLPELREKYELLSDKKVEDLKRDSKETSFEVNINSILKYFNNISKKSDIELLSFRPNKIDEGIEIKTVIRGNFYKTFDFLEKLNQFQGVLIYENLNLSKQGESLQSEIKILFLKRGGSND